MSQLRYAFFPTIGKLPKKWSFSLSTVLLLPEAIYLATCSPILKIICSGSRVAITSMMHFLFGTRSYSNLDSFLVNACHFIRRWSFGRGLVHIWFQLDVLKSRIVKLSSFRFLQFSRVTRLDLRDESNILYEPLPKSSFCCSHFLKAETVKSDLWVLYINQDLQKRVPIGIVIWWDFLNHKNHLASWTAGVRIPYNAVQKIKTKVHQFDCANVLERLLVRWSFPEKGRHYGSW